MWLMSVTLPVFQLPIGYAGFHDVTAVMFPVADRLNMPLMSVPVAEVMLPLHALHCQVEGQNGIRV
jgi:hypothetical protein